MTLLKERDILTHREAAKSGRSWALNARSGWQPGAPLSKEAPAWRTCVGMTVWEQFFLNLSWSRHGPVRPARMLS